MFFAKAKGGSEFFKESLGEAGAGFWNGWGGDFVLGRGLAVRSWAVLGQGSGFALFA
ncbi:MAG: hypothetical protein HC890_15650 [Chloroflexaceae bacterium]|nr:hypothetical protein [Chloroflexaceae bacterium]